jgi:hypothetical protein
MWDHIFTVVILLLVTTAIAFVGWVVVNTFIHSFFGSSERNSNHRR